MRKSARDCLPRTGAVPLSAALFALQRQLFPAAVNLGADLEVALVFRHDPGRMLHLYAAASLRMQAEHRYLETMPRKDPMEELEARLFLHDLASVASRPQYELAALRLQGCSIAEAARQSGMTPKRVRRLLKELYRVYFQLYPNEA